MEHSTEVQVRQEVGAYLERLRARRLRKAVQAGRTGNGFLGWGTYSGSRDPGYRRRAR